MKRGTIIAAAFALLALGSVVTPTSESSWAARGSSALPGPQPGPGPKTGRIEIPVKGVDGATVDTVVCIEYTAPEPQYSGTNKNIHWGVGVSCSEDGPYEMSFEAWLYTITGSGENTKRWQEDHFGPRFGVYLWTHTEGKYTYCLSNTSTRWQTKIKATVDGGNMTPEYAWSDIWTFPCA